MMGLDKRKAKEALDAYHVLAQFASDSEVDAMGDMLKREGVLWDCHGPNYHIWTNTFEDKVCDSCGKPRPKVAQ